MTTDHRESPPTNARAIAFLALAIAGLVAQLILLGVFLGDEGLNLEELGNQMFANPIAALTFVDLGVSAVVFLAWMPREAARPGLRWWPFALATLGGLCFALPLFLSVRERRRIAAGAASSAAPVPVSTG